MEKRANAGWRSDRRRGCEPQLQSIVLHNTDRHKLVVHFLVNGKRHQLKPDHTMTIKLGQDARSVIRFDRGGQFGDVQYLLDSRGADHYKFEVTAWGWDSRRRTEAEQRNVVDFAKDPCDSMQVDGVLIN